MQSIIKYFSLQRIAHSGIGLLLMYSLGCSKSEQAIEQMRFTQVGLNAVTIDSMRLIVTDNGELLTDSLLTPVGNKTLMVQYREPVRRYQVTDMYSNALVLDTMISYKAVSLNAVTFFQPVTGGKLVWVGPPVNEPAPESGKIKLSIVYASPFTTATYDEIKVVVENSKSGTSGSDYAASDSFLIKRGAFSRFFMGGNNRKPQLRLFTADAKRTELTTIVPGSFARANTDFSIYYINLNTITSAVVTKLY